MSTDAKMEIAIIVIFAMALWALFAALAENGLRKDLERRVDKLERKIRP